ncbi:MAG: aldo/keto reductase, partial [Acidobacteriota bacterium]
GLGVLPWSPLARGFLVGNRQRGADGERSGATVRAKTDDYAQNLYYEDGDFAIVDRVGEVAGKLGVSPAQVALAWLLHQPAVTAPIIGASKMKHLEDAVAAVDLALDSETLAYLEEPYRPHPVLGHK